MFQKLLEVKTALQSVPDINSVKIGLESNLTAEACPFIRIIAQPSKPNEDNFHSKVMEVEIIYGEKVNIKTNLEELYRIIYKKEEKIIKAVESIGGVWLETIPDGDMLTSIKVSAIYFRIEVSC